MFKNPVLRLSSANTKWLAFFMAIFLFTACTSTRQASHLQLNPAVSDQHTADLSLPSEAQRAALPPTESPDQDLLVEGETVESNLGRTESKAKQVAASLKAQQMEAKMAKVKQALEQAKVSPEGAGAVKPNLATKLLAKKLAKKMERIKDAQDTEATNELTRNMKIAIILMAAGLLLGILFGSPIGIVGGIVFIVGLVLLIIELINMA